MRVAKVGVVGAGVMGAGVAQALAQTGHDVVLVDTSDEILELSRKEVRNGLRTFSLLSRRDYVNHDEVFARIDFSTDYERFDAVDFVIENVTEKFEVKRPIYERLDQICQPDVVFAANTSAISITKIAALTQRPAQVLGIHFMNPVPLKPMVEVIRGYHTNDRSMDIAKDVLLAMKKHFVVVEDMPGFVSNRVLMLMINEAAFLVQDQVAKAADIDRLFKGCFGHKMGPLETADLIGLDTILLSIEVLYESFRDSKYRPCPLLRKMVDAGLHGRKSGHGFFAYQ